MLFSAATYKEPEQPGITGVHKIGALRMLFKLTFIKITV